MFMCRASTGSVRAGRRDAGPPQPPRLRVVDPPEPARRRSTRLSVWMSPRWRWLNATSSTRPAARAARDHRARPPRRVRAIGFSDSTCSPRSSAATVIGACRNVGTATLTTSSESSSSSSSQRGDVALDAVALGQRACARAPRARRSRRARRRVAWRRRRRAGALPSPRRSPPPAVCSC